MLIDLPHHAVDERVKLTIPTSSAASASALGVGEGQFGYVTAPYPQIGPDGLYQIALDEVRIRHAVAADEIDRE